jgi:hypothetical protein
VQVPVQVPLTQAYGHLEAVSHAPDELHVCTWAPRHWMAVGEHAPAQTPLAQACEGHGVGVPQVPAEHVCTL